MHTMWSKKGKKGWMAIKVDLKKDYDRLKWFFIQEMLEDMQLSHTLVEVIMCCVTNNTIM